MSDNGRNTSESTRIDRDTYNSPHFFLEVGAGMIN